MRLVYLTIENNDKAVNLAKILVTERLVACANILGKINSIYIWEGKLEHSDEVALLLKTSKDKINEVINRIKELHDYDCPCIISWKIKEGNADFLNWVEDSVR